MAEEPANIAIVIVGYNSQAYLADCLASIEHTTYKQKTVIFVDNHSSDQSLAEVKRCSPSTKIIALPKNVGFGQANNCGLDEAKRRGCSHVLFLNPDTVLAPDCLAQLAKQATEKAIYQPLLLLHADGQPTDRINAAGNDLHILGISYCAAYGRARQTEPAMRQITLASGAALYAPLDLLLELHGFDPHFFLYYEDTDLNWRARQHGYPVYLVPAAVVWHKYQFSNNRQKLYYIEHNRLQFLFIHWQTRTIICLLPLLLIHELLVLLSGLFGGWSKQKVRTYRHLWRARQELRLLRRQRQAERQLSDHTLKQWLTPTIIFPAFVQPGIVLYNALLSLYWWLVKPVV